MTTFSRQHVPYDVHARRPRRGGFSLMELLIVIAILGIVAAVIIPNTNTSLATDLNAVGAVIAAEIDYARNLAVTYGSSYEITFSTDGRQFITSHSGSNSALDALPTSAFSAVGDDATQRILRLEQVTSLGGEVWLLGAVVPQTSGNVAVTSVEFGPLGETTRSEATTLWLASGSDRARRFLPIEINPITGLATAGEITTSAPRILTGLSRETSKSDLSASGIGAL